MAKTADKINEQALLLGPRKALVGVMSQAAPGAAADADVAVVVLNSGIIHRVGANRMSVQMCRQLAAAGYPALRFDLSGIGDSDVRDDGLSPLDASMADIKEVLDTLEATRKLRRFILVGLCSGADHSVVYAASDPRVVGLVLLDPSVPRTQRYYVRHYASRALRLRSWLNAALGLSKRLGPRPSLGDDDALRPELERPEVRNFLEQAYRRSVDRGGKFLAVFTDELEHRHNYREQLLDAFPGVPFGRQLRLEFFRDTDHTFTSEANRARVIDLIEGWVREVAGAPAAVEATAKA